MADAARAYGLPVAPSPRLISADVWGADGRHRAVIYASRWQRAFALAAEDAAAELVTCGTHRMWRDAVSRQWRNK